MCASIFLLLFTATLDLVDDVVEKQILEKGTNDEREIIQLDRSYRRLGAYVKESSLLNFAAAFVEFPEELRTLLMTKYELTQARLNEYLGRDEVPLLDTATRS